MLVMGIFVINDFLTFLMAIAAVVFLLISGLYKLTSENDSTPNPNRTKPASFIYSMISSFTWSTLVYP